MSTYSILLADDDPFILAGIGKFLRLEGYVVDTALSGEAAEESLEQREYDLVIVDLVMGVGSGIDVLKKVKDSGADTKVIILTGYADVNTIVDAVRLNVDDFILKPCDNEELLFRVERCMDSLELWRKYQQRTRELEEANEKLRLDIIERKRTEKELTRSEARAQALLNATTDSAMLLDRDGQVLLINQNAAETMRKSMDELIDRNIFDNLNAKVAELRKREFHRVLQTGQPMRFEDEHAGKIQDISMYPVFDTGGIIENVAVYTRDVTTLKNAEKHIHTLSQELIKTQENERKIIAMDLHDNVAQDLGSLKIACDMLIQDSGDLSPAIRDKFRSFTDVLQGSIRTVRNMAYDLQPPSLAQFGLVRALSSYCEDFSKNNGIGVEMNAVGMDRLKFRFETEINLYRLVQEALNNIRKHAEATRITIRFIATHPNVILRIHDNGKGFEVESRMIEALNEKRMGLKSMEERAGLLGGKFVIKSECGNGTQIMVEVPCR